MNNYIFDARERDKLLTELNSQNALIGNMRHEIADLIEQRDTFERDLADAEERENVKDALIDEQRKKIEEMRDEIVDDNRSIKYLNRQIENQAETIRKWRNEITIKSAKDFSIIVKLSEENKELNKECCDLHNVEANLRATIKIRDSQIDELRDHTNNQRKQIETQAENIRRYREDNKELIAANEILNDRIKKMDKKLRDHEGNNSDNNIVIEYQKKKIHELERQLRKYKVAGMFIKASLEAAEDPEVPKYEKHS